MQTSIQLISLQNKAGFLHGKKFVRLLVLFVLFLIPFSKAEAQNIYVADAFGNVYVVDLATCASSIVAPSSGPSWYDLAICSNNPNIMYGTDGANNGSAGWKKR